MAIVSCWGKRILQTNDSFLHLALIMTEESCMGMSKGVGDGRAGDMFSLIACMTCFFVAWVLFHVLVLGVSWYPNGISFMTVNDKNTH